LKYLLNQSDIFSHFGLGGKAATSSNAFEKEEKKNASEKKSTRNRGGSGNKIKSSNDIDELDEDEKQMIEDEENEQEGDISKNRSTLLLKQPSIVVGGAMRAYQLEGLNWMIRLLENGINGILADEMGLGKTLQSISVLAYMNEFMNVKGPHLIMVPKSTLSNWMNEFKFWCPTIRCLRFHGTKEERQVFIDDHLRASLTQDQRDWDVIVTTYEIVNMEKTALGKIAWRYLIIDEAHRLKNEDSQFSQTVRQLNTQYRLLLTGTPLQNNLHELWALLNFLLPDVFASSDQFDEWFNLDVDDTEAKQRIISQLHKILRPFMLRRLKADVEKSLPPKTETILFTGMSAVQTTLYKQILLRDIDTVNGGANASGSRTQILNICMQLRKCCNHPYLFPGIEDRSMDPLGDHLVTSCGKMVLLDKLLIKMKQRDHRVLIFSQMTRMLDILEDYLISKGYLYCRIDGNTSYDVSYIFN
jgi:SWI/SNF-related matrix-associated actin-dependent regulator of chromatin subfamily A member 5